MKSIFEYLLGKKKNTAFAENFNLKMKPDDVIKLLYGFEVEELSVGEYWRHKPQENAVYIMKSLNAFGGKDIKFNIQSRIYTFSFGDTKLEYISLEYKGQIYSSFTKEELEKTLNEINELMKF